MTDADDKVLNALVANYLSKVSPGIAKKFKVNVTFTSSFQS